MNNARVMKVEEDWEENDFYEEENEEEIEKIEEE